MKRKIVVIGLTIFIVVCILYFAVAGCSYGKNKEHAFVTSHNIENTTNLCQVDYIRAKDGDTLVVNCTGKETTIRLVGIDTPESVHPDKSKNTQEGNNASEYVKELLKDTKTLWLEYDDEMIDKYGRTLAYVWLTPDITDYNNMLNYKLVKNGVAIAKEYKPNTKYSDVLKNVK